MFIKDSSTFSPETKIRKEAKNCGEPDRTSKYNLRFWKFSSKGFGVWKGDVLLNTCFFYIQLEDVAIGGGGCWKCQNQGLSFKETLMKGLNISRHAFKASFLFVCLFVWPRKSTLSIDDDEESAKKTLAFY